ncbi:MAG: hypothetical protein H7X86_11225 [Gorillibacterium sp.]|nr:hypothetical protein [Gorillibacterium sp.]
MLLIVSIIAIVVVGIVVFFQIPYSKLKADFNKITTEQIRQTKVVQDVFTLDDIKGLPAPVQRYFEYCGYIGTPKMSHMKATFKNVDFAMSPDKPKIKIDYTQHNFVAEPVRFAYIDSSMYGIPFQGLDAYDGHGSMKGVLAKTITLFNQKGKEMDVASLVTVLSESLVVPNVALQDYIVWEEMDNTHAKATISYYGISATGEFTFNEKGEMLSFTTNDRAVISSDGTIKQVPWTAILGDYRETKGIKQPTLFQAVWHYDAGDLVYFDGHMTEIVYDSKQ